MYVQMCAVKSWGKNNLSLPVGLRAAELVDLRLD